MKRDWIVVAATIVVTVGVMRVLFPPKEPETPIPNIVTKYDTVTVATLPNWFQDSVKLWKKRKHTTDTVNIYVTQTLVRDTGSIHYVYVGADTGARPKVWPVLSYRGGSTFASSAVVNTFNLRTGEGGISTLFVPGILTAIEADTGMAPKLTFVPFPDAKRPSLFYKLKLLGLGFGACAIVNTVR